MISRLPLALIPRSLRGLLTVPVLLAGLSPALARPLTEVESAALGTTVAAFDAAVGNGDFEAIIEIIPPRMIEHIADEAKVPVDELLAALKTQIDEVFATVELVSFGMDAENAEQRELADGSPYVLIPTTTVMEADGLGRIQVDSHTLGLLDTESWYQIRVGDAAMVGVLRQVYPQFVDVEFPSETMKALED